MNIIQQLRRDEGVVSFAYDDATGLPVRCEGFVTVGVGFLVDKRKGGGLDDAEIDFILDHRTNLMARELAAAWPPYNKLDAVRRGALLNMAYNLGAPGLLKFKKFLAACAAADWAEAGRQMEDSAWWRQVGARAQRLRQQIETGEWV